jgi:phospholipase D1/2
MGWADISISLSGPIVDSLAIHFVERWSVQFTTSMEVELTNPHRNYIFNKKYSTRDAGKYKLLQPPNAHRSTTQHLMEDPQEYFGGLQNRFSKKMHHFLGDEEEAPHGSQRPSEGAHIQLTRRYGQHALCQGLR